MAVAAAITEAADIADEKRRVQMHSPFTMFVLYCSFLLCHLVYGKSHAGHLSC